MERSNSRRFRLLRTAPVCGRDAFPHAEGAHEGVGVLVSEEVCGLVEFEHRVGEVMTRKLMTSIFEDLLKTGA